MNVFKWFKNWFSGRGAALFLYRRGMARARKHDHRGAIDDYTATINLPDLPPDIRSMALYNRALVYDAANDEPKAVEDLHAVLSMAAGKANVKTEAKRKLARMERRAQQDSG